MILAHLVGRLVSYRKNIRWSLIGFAAVTMTIAGGQIQIAQAAAVPLVNANFDAQAADLPNNNQFNFTGPTPGWDKIDLATGLIDNSIANVGPINVDESQDITVGAFSQPLAMYVQQYANVVRVDQTTGHAISAGDESFTLSVQIGNDSFGALDRFGGFTVSLYAYNSSNADPLTNKTLLKTITGSKLTATGVAQNAWEQRTLTVVDDVDVDLDLYVGQAIGIGLGCLGDTFIHPAAPHLGELAGIVFYDDVALDVTTSTTAHPGDFDSDGDVDGADFVAWQTHFPTATGATLADGDADADGDVDGADFVVWQTNFPFTPGPGVSSVPEPNAIGLILLTMLGFSATRKKFQAVRTRANEPKISTWLAASRSLATIDIWWRQFWINSNENRERLLSETCLAKYVRLARGPTGPRP